MTPESLLDTLESLGKVDAKILGKLRRQSEKSEKNVTVKKILSFLVKNDHLTKEEAVEIRRSLKAKTKLEYADARNSEDLVAGVIDSPAEIADDDDDDEEDVADFDEPLADEILDSPNPVVDAAAEVAPAAPAYDPLADPMAGGWETSSAHSNPNAQTSSVASDGRSSKAAAFKGKRDTSDQWASRWVFIGFGILGLLLIAGVLLTLVLGTLGANQRFEAAVNSYKSGTYGDAVKKCNEFIDKHPSHENVPEAKVIRVQSLLLETFRKNLDETIVRAEKNLPPLLEDENVELDSLREELALILPNTVLDMAKRATKQETKAALIEQLDKAKSAKQLVDNPEYIPRSKRKQATLANLLEKIDEEIAKGDILVRRQEDYDAALVQIADLREQGQTDKAFNVYNQLIRNYGDLRSSEKLQSEMRLVSQTEAQLVKPIEPDVATVAGPVDSAVQSSVVLAANVGNPIESLQGEILPILADGSVYGLDAGNGAVRWRRFVGYQTSIQPLTVDADRIMIADQRENSLLMLTAKDGEVIWRCEIGDSFLAPQLDDGYVYLTAESGKLFRIKDTDGAVMAAAQIPQKANVPMVRLARQKLVLQPGYYSNLYILDDEDLSCKDVIYLGHQPGSIFANPVAWKNHVLVCINVSGACDLYVLRYNSETKAIELSPQRIRPLARGLVTSTPTRFGRFMVVNSEEGDLKILQIDSANETTPISILDAEKFENPDNAKTYLAAAGSQLWVASKGIQRFKFSRSKSSFDRQMIADSDDDFLGPLTKYGDNLIHVRKRNRSGMTSVSAVDGKTLEPLWRTDLGGALAGPPLKFDGRVWAISSQGDLFDISINLAEDQFISSCVKSSNIAQDLLFDRTLELGSGRRFCLGPQSRSEALFVDGQKKSTKLIRLQSPADRRAAEAVVVDGDVIVPTLLGQVVRIKPENGRVVGTPFLPPTQPGTEVNWKTPAVVNQNQLVIGVENSLYLLDAADKKVIRRVAELQMDSQDGQDLATIKSGLVAIGDRVFGVFGSTDANMIYSIDVTGKQIQINETAELSGSVIAGPWVVGDRVMMRQADYSLVCFDADLNLAWSAKLPPNALATAPLIDGTTLRVIFGTGDILNLDPNTGEVNSKFSVGQPVAHQPIVQDGVWLFSGADGTIHSVDLQ